ncbi:hypothetical protein [Streptomyces sp. NPDC047009]|uniref:plasmid mobilization protein n=1 Tax=Streptomyces sp. NPDC047009 TaxID=3154496 RepID=UPI0033C73471
MNMDAEAYADEFETRRIMRVRVTESERRTIRLFAQDAGMSPSRWLRQRLGLPITHEERAQRVMPVLDAEGRIVGERPVYPELYRPECGCPPNPEAWANVTAEDYSAPESAP